MNFIIAGASQGTGKELVKLLVNEGNKVVALARRKEKLDALEEEVEQNLRKNLIIRSIDLTDGPETENLFQELSKNTQGPTTLIHCAATWTGGTKVKEWKLEKFKEAMDLNFYTGFNAITSFVRSFKYTTDAPNSVIVLGATASLRGGKTFSAFAIPKGGLRFLCQSLAREEAENGLHVTHLILDGLIDNPRTRELNPGRAENKFMKMISIVNTISYLTNQSRDAWTLELDLRPDNENF